MIVVRLALLSEEYKGGTPMPGMPRSLGCIPVAILRGGVEVQLSLLTTFRGFMLDGWQ